MGFFDFFPYTNFHNVNLDWVLQRVKEWGELVEANNTAFQNLEEANASFKEYVTNYLQNLDVQAEIDDKLDRMFESGELTDYLEPYIASNVSQWLDENITEPTGVIIDSSLTVSGACADAKATGDKIDEEIHNLSSQVFNGLPAIEHTNLYDKHTGQLPNKYSLNPAGTSSLVFQIVETQNYNSYYFYMLRDCYFWLDEIPSYYTAIGKINNAGELTPNSDNPVKYVVNGSNPVRLRTLDGNIPLVNTKLLISSGSFISFTIPDTVDISTVHFNFQYNGVVIDTTLFNNSIALNSRQVSTVKGGLIQYITRNSPQEGSLEDLNIYIKHNNNYIRYDFIHSIYQVRNCDIWRISNAKKCNIDLIETDSITTRGEWECAIKLANRNDFSGGLIHGNEITNGIIIILNGAVVDKTSLSNIKAFETLEILQVSTLYDNSNPNRAFATHTSKHSFSNGSMFIEQTIEFLDSFNVELAYLSMFPISKLYSAHYFTDSNFEYRETTVPISDHNAKSVSLLGDDTESIFELVSIDSGYNDNYLSIQDNGGQPYNKCYYITARNTAVDSDTMWKVKTRYEII